MKIESNTRVVSAGVTITLNKDETGGLIVALGDYIRLMKEHGNYMAGKKWPWVEELKAELEKIR